MITAEELERRLAAAKTDEEYDAVTAWLVEQGMDEKTAAEHVAVCRMTARGEPLPDSSLLD